MTDGSTTSILKGLAELLAAAGLGVWRPTGTYQAGDTGITIANAPPSPDRIICLTGYPVADGPLTSGVLGVQIRLRAGRDPSAVQDLADDLFEVLHNRAHTVLGGIKCPLIWRQSQAWIGSDSDGRQELTANYYLNTERPPGAHLDE